jgi:hypothetical protein
MAFTMLGAEFPDDAADLSDCAFRTHVEGMVWSAKRGLDMRIPKRDLVRFAFSPTCEDGIRELLAFGWWVDRGDYYELVHDSAAAQWTSAQQERQRTRWRRAQAHKRGNHTLCLPGKCSDHASSDDSSVESSEMSSGSLEERREEKASTTGPVRNEFGLGRCNSCNHLEQLDDDALCRSCAREVTP